MQQLFADAQAMSVAPHAGAWIETTAATEVTASGQEVAPHAGAWIETVPEFPTIVSPASVAPHAGAWIETELNPLTLGVFYGRTPRGCVD